jgi:hypothetical protein
MELAVAHTHFVLLHAISFAGSKGRWFCCLRIEECRLIFRKESGSEIGDLLVMDIFSRRSGTIKILRAFEQISFVLLL